MKLVEELEILSLQKKVCCQEWKFESKKTIVRLSSGDHGNVWSETSSMLKRLSDLDQFGQELKKSEAQSSWERKYEW